MDDGDSNDESSDACGDDVDVELVELKTHSQTGDQKGFLQGECVAEVRSVRVWVGGRLSDYQIETLSVRNDVSVYDDDYIIAVFEVYVGGRRSGLGGGRWGR